MQESPPFFFFWLYGWDTRFVSGYRFQPHYTFCRVDKEELYLQDAHVRFCVPLSNIGQWKIVREHMGNFVFANLEITLLEPVRIFPGATTGHRIYLMPMNVFRLNPSWSETKALAQVLDYVKHGSNITLDPNPYMRSPRWLRGKPPADGWNPTTPPYVYTAPLTLAKLLLGMALGMLCIIVVFTVIYLMYLLLGSR